MADGDDDPLADVDEDSVPVEIAADQLRQEFDRPRGVFTPTDRQFLSGFKEYEHRQSATNRRQGIRERTEHALRDFRLLEWVDSNERAKIFDSIPPGELHDSVAHLIAFLYRGLDGEVNPIEQMIRSGIYMGAQQTTAADSRPEGASEVTVDIDVEYGDARAIYDRLQDDPEYADRLTPTEIGVLVRADMLDEKEYRRLASGEQDTDTMQYSSADRPWYFEEANESDES